MEFRILGPLEVRDGGRPLSFEGGKQRVLLGVLLLHANRVVSSERLVDELWGAAPPARAAKLVQGYVSGVRKALGPDRLLTQAPGYLLRLAPGELDLNEFERLVAEGHSEQEPGRAADLMREALALWRGHALVDLRFEAQSDREAERLNDMRLAALLERIDADLAVGRHAQLVGELEALIAEHPLQERPRAQVMLALYRSGRQAEALEVYRATRRLLADELGLEPSQELERLERLILTHDAELDLPRVETPVPAPLPQPPTAAPPGRADRVRRTVSFLFADLVDSTRLAEQFDPETMHRVLARFSEACNEAIERHGGVVEKYIGDAVAAVFGFPTLHEDDALRAVRAAVEVRQAVAELADELARGSAPWLAVTLGVNSGEVFVGPGHGRDAFASGDAINVAARLNARAEGGEILLGEDTYRLVATAVRAEELGPLTVKGRTAPVRAWRLLELGPDELALVRPATTPFVGRRRELAMLEREFAEAGSARACRLCTVLGPPGIGKSRLARELVETLGNDATVIVGRCLSYGQGITYRPLAEIVRRFGGDQPRERIGALLHGDEDADLVTERVLGAIGLGEPGGREETFWAVRRVLEAAARDRPLVAVVEDVHWAEPTLLDLLDYVAGFSSGQPILLLCLARPELLEAHPDWAAPRPGRSLLALDPLPEHEARGLVDSLGVEDLDAQTRARIVETAEGNPLFLEQLVAMEAVDREATLPPSVQAVLAARIDSLESGERTVLERASVEGRSFHRSALAELLPDQPRTDVEAHLLALVHKQLIRPDAPEFAGDDGFRFTHVLTRDAAYSMLPKEVRAELHEVVANWLETKPARHDEIVGYHLEQAYRYRTDVAGRGDLDSPVAVRAATLLEAGGRKALSRSDLPAAINLLERASALLPPSDPTRAALVTELGTTLVEAGRLAEAAGTLREASRMADALDDDRLGAHALVQQALLGLLAAADATEDAAAVVDRVLPVFTRDQDELGMCRARRLQALVYWIQGRTSAAEASWYEAAAHARGAGASRDEADSLLWLASAALLGPTPAEDGIARCEEIRPMLAAHPMEEALVLPALAALRAMVGEFDEARRLLGEANTTLADFGVTLGAKAHSEALVAMLADEPSEAERCLRADYDERLRMGEKGFLSTTAALLARAVEAQGRHDEAEELTEIAKRTGAPDDLSTQIVWRGVRARVLAERGLRAEAEELAREAVRLAERTDRLNHHADAVMDLAAVLRISRSADELEAVGAALRLYEQKRNMVAAAKVRGRLDVLEEGISAGASGRA